jgi:hypothetical protein
MNRFTFLKITLFLVISAFSFNSTASETYTETFRNEGIGEETYKGKRKRNNPSKASRSSLSSQTKHAKRSIRRNDRRNKILLKQRAKKQKRQKRYSKRDTFRY